MVLRDFDIHGPAGPTAFWKVSNEIDEGGEDTTLFDDDDEDDEDFTDGDEDEEESDDDGGRPDMIFHDVPNTIGPEDQYDAVWPGTQLH